METYKEFLDRINSFEMREWSFEQGDFKGNPSLIKKVKSDNSFRDFYGDTVVFHLNAENQKRIEMYLDKLYKEASECFCERLLTGTIHMTLHDLCNSNQLSEVAEEMTENEKKISLRCKEVNMPTIIKMRSTSLFNMVNTSLVLGLCPVDEAEYQKLMSLYGIIDEIKELPYPLTPHITLAYYNVNGFSDASARKLEALVCGMNQGEEIEVALDGKELYYQRFCSMNEYVDILPIYYGTEPVSGNGGTE